MYATIRRYDGVDRNRMDEVTKKVDSVQAEWEK